MNWGGILKKDPSVYAHKNLILKQLQIHFSLFLRLFQLMDTRFLNRLSYETTD
jgi:hypothetical protein